MIANSLKLLLSFKTSQLPSRIQPVRNAVGCWRRTNCLATAPIPQIPPATCDETVVLFKRRRNRQMGRPRINVGRNGKKGNVGLYQLSIFFSASNSYLFLASLTRRFFRLAPPSPHSPSVDLDQSSCGTM